MESKKYNDNLSWWGYEHVNGSIIVKRVLDDENYRKDFNSALESDFVKTISCIVYAENRKEAIKLIKKELE